MGRIRTVDVFCDEQKQQDPNTAITRHAVRQALINGDVSSGRMGVKYTFDEDDMLDFFRGKLIAGGSNG